MEERDEGGEEAHEGDEPGEPKDRALERWHHFAAPEEATDSARAAVENNLGQMTALPLVFPADAVGEGARWTVTGPVSDSASGVAMRQTVTYTLTSRSGSRVELDVDIERIPTVKQMAGTDLEVLDSKSTSSGSLTRETESRRSWSRCAMPSCVIQSSRISSAIPIRPSPRFSRRRVWTSRRCLP